MTLIVLDATFDVSVIGLPIAIALHFLVIYHPLVAYQQAISTQGTQ